MTTFAHRLLAAGGGVLISVLWFDLMFDVQVFGHAGETLPEAVLASIAAYYRRVTMEAGMTLPVLVFMVATIGAALFDLAKGVRPVWVRATGAVLCIGPVFLAWAKIMPEAARLATRADSVAVQSELARSICNAHIICLVSITLFLALQLAPIRALSRERQG